MYIRNTLTPPPHEVPKNKKPQKPYDSRVYLMQTHFFMEYQGHGRHSLGNAVSVNSKMILQYVTEMSFRGWGCCSRCRTTALPVPEFKLQEKMNKCQDGGLCL
jgi:hypothetical protein